MDFNKGKHDQATLNSTLDFSPSSAGTKTSFTEMNLQEIKLSSLQCLIPKAQWSSFEFTKTAG